MNKKILRTLTALCAALMLSGGFSVTAFAQTPEGEDDTNDSGVVYEEPQKEEPLTPDGNATLVDDFGGNKQLIIVTTKNGNYFYILIDRDDEGENTVHWTYALIDKGENRDREIRKPRPSIRAQLKADKAKTAPKKAAAKTKNHDMEV